MVSKAILIEIGLERREIKLFNRASRRFTSVLESEQLLTVYLQESMTQNPSQTYGSTHLLPGVPFTSDYTEWRGIAELEPERHLVSIANNSVTPGTAAYIRYKKALELVDALL